MEFSEENKDRLEKIGLAATALVVGGAIVYYVRNKKGQAEGYVYKPDSGNSKIGVYTDTVTSEYREFGGFADGEGFEPDPIDISEAEIVRFEEVFARHQSSSDLPPAA